MNILIIYDSYSQHPLRQAFADHLYSFSKYSSHHVFYCNYAYGIPAYISKIKFDLIIFHQFFCAQFRWCGLSYEAYTRRLKNLKPLTAPKVLFCQDEFFKMDHIVRFINEFGIEKVFSVAEESEWDKIYRGVKKNKVQFHKVLTGYLDDNICSTIENLKKEIPSRDIDIGYRAWHVPAWLGRHGKLKTDIADVIRSEAEKKGLRTDISTVNDEKNIFHGLDWYRFMLRCQCFIGVEGGSSLLDEKGEIYHRVKAYTEKHPKSSFEEIERACFPGLDGNLSLFALSPRHLESCAARNCQILIEGSYSGILKPNIHYMELKKDFSNVQEVLDKVQNKSLTNEMTDRAYRDIVLSKRYTYSTFVTEVFKICFEDRSTQKKPGRYPLLYRFNLLRERFLWKRMPYEFYWFKKFKKILPNSMIDCLKKFRNRSAGV